jgi:hypothetical protein
MLDSNKNNSQCGFSEQIVSFLYDEMKSSDKHNFEQHLLNCQFCGEEMVSFSSVRSSMQEWRTMDFEKLSLPVFHISKAEKVASDSTSWLERIAAYFTIQNAGLSAAAMMTIIVLTVVFWFSFNKTNNNHIAAISDNTKNLVANTSTDKAVDNKVEIIDNKQKTLTSAESSALSMKSLRTFEKSVSKAEKASNSSKKSNVSPNFERKSVLVNSPRINPETVAKTVNKKKFPSITVVEEKDTSLRLADIFEEVSLN